MKRNGLLLIVALFLTGQSAVGAECTLTIDRKACAGKETDAFKPYGGKNPTEEKTKDASADACVKAAEAAAKIIRKGTLASKTVTAKFDGKAVGTKSDRSECK